MRATTRVVAVLAGALLAAAGGAATAEAAPFVYAINFNTANVAQFDAAGGGLAPLTPATVAAGTQPTVGVISPDGASLYVSNQGGSTVSQFTIAADGTISAKSPASVASGTAPRGMAISPDGTSLYVANQSTNNVSHTTSPRAGR
jgi:DNA-binding beta-propeller fold protein YncE